MDLVVLRYFLANSVGYCYLHGITFACFIVFFDVCLYLVTSYLRWF